jgi:hypothetical protein
VRFSAHKVEVQGCAEKTDKFSSAPKGKRAEQEESIEVRRWLGLAAAFLIGPASAGATSDQRAPQPRTFYYLHGKVVEDFGPRGVNPRFGAYDLPGIVSKLSEGGVAVIAEQRPSGTNVSAYADHLVNGIRAKLNKGVAPAQITVAGASKGAVIAALVSSRLKVAGVRYVLMGNCNDWLIETFKPRLTGDVLSIYELSDEIGGSCAKLARFSPKLGIYEEVKLSTGLGHGFLYRPLDAWVRPALAWAKR